MRNKTTTKEKVSTVGIRNQVTMPRDIRQALGLKGKMKAAIRAVKGGKKMVITGEIPAEGVYSVASRRTPSRMGIISFSAFSSAKSNVLTVRE